MASNAKSASAEPGSKIELKAAIAALRQQLREATVAAQVDTGPPRFVVHEVDLELTVVAEDSASAGGEVGWWIFKAKADIAAKDAVTHKVRMTLKLVDPLPVSSGTQTD